MTEFERAFKHILRYEGGYSNDPDDPGGETKFGISKRSYPQIDIAHLTVEDAATIYERDFWLPLRCNDLPCPVDIIVFDAAINCGKVRAAKWLQEEINGLRCQQQQLGIDGVIGAMTIAATKQCDPHQLGMLLIARRQLHYLGLRKKMPQFFDGWIGRTTDLLRIAAG